MRRLFSFIIPLLAAAAHPAAAQEITYEVIEEEVVVLDLGTTRFVDSAPAPLPRGLAAYGPFRVIDDSHAALVDVTDERSPAAFAALLRDHPGIAVLEMIDCPGTDDDQANLRLGRMIRRAGIATHVPDGGSVRSGAVELFLAGVRRMAEPRAEFAVHSWMDQDGLEPKDYAPGDQSNRIYIDYYQAMGMDAAQAAAFYAMTNSVPNADAKWLTAADMGQWVRLDAPEAAVHTLASLDLGHALN